jgi:hypothetical protein
MPRWRTWRPEVDAERADAWRRVGGQEQEFKGELCSALKHLSEEGTHPQELDRQGPVRCVGVYNHPGTLYVFFTSLDPKWLTVLHLTALVGRVGSGAWPPPPPPPAWALARARVEAWGL